MLEGLDLHGLASLGWVFFNRQDDILCEIFFSLLIWAEICQRRHLHIRDILLRLATESAEISLRHPDCLFQLRQMQVLRVGSALKFEIGGELIGMEKGAA